MGRLSVLFGCRGAALRGACSVFVALALHAAGGLPAAELKPATLKAFDIYIRDAESHFEKQLQGEHFLWADGDAARLARIRRGEILVEPWIESRRVDIPDGLVHDWIGSVFVPGTTVNAVLTTVQDYDHHKITYKSEVLESRLLSRRGDEFRIYLRVQKKKVQTVVLNTEHLARYYRMTPFRTYSWSRSTRIAEIEHAGEDDERERPEGNDHGYLWRLNSYWKFEERDGGVYVECRAISLTRGVPKALQWLIGPIIRGVPRESLTATLAATRDAVVIRK